MLRQAREIFALPVCSATKKTQRVETGIEKSNKKAKKVDKRSKLKVSQQLDNDENNKSSAPKSSALPASESMLRDHLEENVEHRRRQDHSSSSGGSSSGYLSQAVAFQSNEDPSDRATIEHDSFETQDRPAGKAASGQNGSYHLEQTHQSDRQLNSTLASMIDVRPQHHRPPNGRHQHQHLRGPTMVPMMIDDDDGDDDDDDDDDEDLDVRQMLASHRERLRAGERDQRQQEAQNAHYGGLIDGLPALTTDDTLSRPTRGQGRRTLAQAQTLLSMIPHHHHHHHQQHANSQHDEDHGFSRHSLHSSQASGATFGRPHHQQLHLQQDRPVSYLYSGRQSLDHRLHSSRHQYLNRLTAGPDQLHQHQQARLDTAPIYYQPNLHHSEHRYQQQQQQQQEPHHKTYEYPRYLRTSSSFAHHQAYATHQIGSRRRHHQLSAAQKPVPPLPPAQSQQRSSNSLAATNGQLKGPSHQHQLQQEADARMMQASGSRQHLTTSPEQQMQHSSSACSPSPHARRNNLKQAAHSGSSQLISAKQSLRPVPNRSTPAPAPTPSQLTRANGPAAAQMLPASGLSGELARPMSCCGKLAKFLLFIANALFWAAGIALGAWGILGLVDDHKYNLSQLLVFEPSTRMSLFQLLSWSFITLGCATILVGFCACSAMFKNSRWILGLYIFLVLAIFALDLATGLLAIIFQERLVANVRLRLVNKLRTDYGIQASFTAAIDYIQTRYECCGLEGHLDYDQSLWRLQRLGGFEATVARTCCHLRNTFDDQAHVNPRPVNESMCQSTDVRFHQSYRYRRGCLDDLERLIRHKIWTFTIGCGAVGAIILLSLVFATCFCRSIPNTSGSRKSSGATASGNRVYHQQTAYLEATNPKKTKHSSSHR